MNRSRVLSARSAALAGVVATAALVLAGCGPSSSGASGGSSGATSGSTAKSGGGSSGTNSAADQTSTAAYFPVSVGNTWVYSTDGFGGKGTLTAKMVSITPTSAGQKVTMTSTITYPTKTTTTETLLFRPDGSIQVPVSQFGDNSITLSSGAIMWPSAAQLASGTPYSDTLVMKIKVAGKDETMRMPLVVKGDGTVTVTVPAGTYQASIINESMTSDFDGYKITMAVRTWVANGVGPVKSEVFSEMLGGSSTKPALTEELESFTKG